MKKNMIEEECEYPENNSLYIMLLSGNLVTYGDEARTKQRHVTTHQIYKGVLDNTLSDKKDYYCYDITNIIKEYKNHLKRNAYPLAIIGGAFAILMIFIISLLSRGMFLNERQYNTISSNDYKYVVESSNLNPVSNVYYKMEQLVTCESEAERRFHVNTYMDLQGVTYDNSPLTTKQLNNNEVAVSKKVAEKLKLSVGDKLNLHIGIYEDSVEYIIVEIIDYVDDFYNFKGSPAKRAPLNYIFVVGTVLS
jgi:hypothetical protein